MPKLIKENGKWIMKEEELNEATKSIAQLVRRNIDEIVDVFILFLKRDHGFTQKQAIDEVKRIKDEIGYMRFFANLKPDDYFKMSRKGLEKALSRKIRKSIWLSGQNAVNDATFNK